MMDSHGIESTSSSHAAVTNNPAVSFIKLCLIWAAFHHHNSPPPPACKSVLSEQNISKLQANGDLGRILDSLDKSPYGQSRGNNVLDKRGGGGSDLFGRNHMTMGSHFKYTSRSLSVIGVLGGIVLILLVAALSTCIRNRRNMLMESNANSHENFARQILIDHIRHLSRHSGGHGHRDSVGDDEEEVDRSNDVPPSYEDVVKDESELHIEDESPEQPPSYVEAMDRIPDSRRRAATTEEEMEMQTQSRSHVVTIEVSGSPLRRRANSTASTSRRRTHSELESEAESV